MATVDANLRELLDRRAADTSAQVWVDGAYVDRVPTIPLDAGLPAIVRFATRCWRENLSMKQREYSLDRKLAVAEDALLRMVNADGLRKDLAIALSAVQAARRAS